MEVFGNIFKREFMNSSKDLRERFVEYWIYTLRQY